MKYKIILNDKKFRFRATTSVKLNRQLTDIEECVLTSKLTRIKCNDLATRLPLIISNFLSPSTENIFVPVYLYEGGSVAEWLACWTQVQKGPGSNRSRDAVG